MDRTIWIIRIEETGDLSCKYGTYDEAVEKAERMVEGTKNTYIIA